MALSYGAPPAKLGDGTSVRKSVHEAEFRIKPPSPVTKITTIVGDYPQHFVDGPSIMSESRI
jgi:hypothetical protein